MKRRICLVLALAILLSALGAALAEGPEFARRYEEAARHGDVNAAIRLAEMYEEGRDVKRDQGRAQYFYDLAANQLGADELLELAQSREGAGKFSIAAAWYQRAADKGGAQMQFQIGCLYARKQSGGWQDAIQAVDYLNAAILQEGSATRVELRAATDEDANPAELCNALMQAHLDGALTNNRLYSILLSLIGEEAESLGSYLADLGWEYSTRNDESPSQDDARSVYWYRLSAEQGDARGQYNLGYMYQVGRGVEQNDALAAYWYKLAAEQGNANAQNNLGYMYAAGEGVEQDDAQAVYWYKLAADQGNASAQYNLADKYENGLGVEKDISEAIRWYELAAEQGLEEAQDALDRLLG